MFYLKTLYTTIMYQVKMVVILFLVAFFSINSSYSQEISPKDEIKSNYWGLIEPVLQCKATHQYMIQQSLDYSYLLGFFDNKDPNSLYSVTEFLNMVEKEMLYLETIAQGLKDIAVPESEYTIQARKDVVNEMLNIERQSQAKYYVDWFKSRSVSDGNMFQMNLKRSLAYCINQRRHWNNILEIPNEEETL